MIKVAILFSCLLTVCACNRKDKAGEQKQAIQKSAMRIALDCEAKSAADGLQVLLRMKNLGTEKLAIAGPLRQTNGLEVPVFVIREEDGVLFLASKLFAPEALIETDLAAAKFALIDSTLTTTAWNLKLPIVETVPPYDHFGKSAQVINLQKVNKICLEIGVIPMQSIDGFGLVRWHSAIELSKNAISSNDSLVNQQILFRTECDISKNGH
jgi:hypothetical protein